jgi:hypothetical protein
MKDKDMMAGIGAKANTKKEREKKNRRRSK